MRVVPVRRPRQRESADVVADRLSRLAGAAPVDGSPFLAELDVSELDDRRKPGGVWSGRGVSLSRSHLVFRSRRMCYAGRLLLVLVHLVDDRPAPLFGQVRVCDYDADGQYRTVLELMLVPTETDVMAWIRERDARGSVASTPPLSGVARV